ncbi:MAG: Outer membrane porin F [Flavobacterium sp. SCGC AAA160-P02]|nr:MAG: Outer membrane porin F [Flavobacterium sp. SCGC AAA160-P02]
MKDILFALAFFLFCLDGYSQSHTRHAWNFKIGINLVDNSGDVDLFEGLTQPENHAYGKIPLVVGLGKRINNYIGIDALASINYWNAENGIIDGNSFLVNTAYYSFDLGLKFYLDEFFKVTSNLHWLDIYGKGGVGYFKISDNSFSLNYALGTSIWLSETVGLNFEVVAKNPLNSNSDNIEDEILMRERSLNTTSQMLDTPHLQYSMSLIIKLSNKRGLSSKEKTPIKPSKADNLDSDSDGDSISDLKDMCPNDAGFPDNNGCPYTDTDKDGVINRADNCPNISGSPSNNGCPIEKKQETIKQTIIKEEKLAVEQQQDLISLSKKIKFESGNYNFTQSTYPHLIEIIKLLNEMPKNIKFKIIGHTDSIGSYEYNRNLSNRRAYAVRNYFIDSGISRGRMEAIGFGESEPVDTNLTRKGRSNNRRIEIFIIK